MQRKLIRKDKWKYSKSFITSFIPLCCIVALLALCILAINPNGSIVSNGSAYATDSDSTSNSGISTQSIDSPNSSASLTIGNGTSTQFTNTGTSDQDIEINVDVNIRTNLIDSYTLQISGNPTLDGKTSINAVTSSSTTLANNTWGYKWNCSTSYKGISTTSTTLESTNITNSNGIIDTTKTLTFAAKFDDEAEAGHYKTDVMLSLLANPKKVAEIGEWTLPDGTIKASGITTMQEMTPEVCEQVANPGSGTSYDNVPKMQLTDSRDGSVYSIARMQDGRCWMTNNLHLRLSTSTTLTPSNTNISSNWTPTNSTLSSLSSSDFSSSNYYKVESYIATPNANVGSTGYYSWTAATAGWDTTGSKTSGYSPQSICPKGWRLPTGGSSGEFQALYNASGISGGNTSPWYYTGATYASTSLNNATTGGYWWSSTVYNSNIAYYMYVYSSGVGPANYNYRYFGYAIRCVAAERDLTSVSTMQEMTPEVCEKSTIGATNTLTDTRDGSTYSIRKMENSKCWMTQNLRIVNKTISSSDSNIASSFIIPASSTSGFSSDTAYNAYLGADANGVATGYYTWCVATAGTCSSATKSGNHAASSICPKGWRLPGGYNDEIYGNEFHALLNSMNLGITISSTASYTTWGSAQLNIIQDPETYKFAYTDYRINSLAGSDFNDYVNGGAWWSSTAHDSTGAYRLYYNDLYTFPGTIGTFLYYRRYGLAIRCIAQ